MSDEKYSAKLGIIVVIGLLIRLIGATRAGIWYDETVSITLASGTFSDIFRGLKTSPDASPPFFNLILHFWISVFGDKQIAVELLSIFAGVMTIVAVYYAGGLFFSSQAGLFAAMFLAFSPFHVKYSQEVRPYAWGALFVLLSFYFFYQYLYQGKKKARWGYYLFTLLALYTHNLVLLPLSVQGMFLLFYLVKKKIRVGDFISLTAPVILLYLPWISVVSSQISRVTANYWVGPLTWKKLARFGVKLSINDGIKHKLFTLFALLPLAAVFFRGISDKEAQESRNLLFGYLVLPVLLLVVISLALRPLFVNRYLFFIVPAFFLLLGQGITRFSDRVRQISLTGLILLVFVSSLTFDYLNPSAPHAKFQEAFFAEHYEPNDGLVYFDAFNYLSGRFYAAGKRPTLFFRKDMNPHLLIPPSDMFNQAGQLAKFPRLWIIESLQQKSAWRDLLGIKPDQIIAVFQPPESRKGRQIKAVYLVDNQI